MMDWIMQRFGASVEELANEQYEELMGWRSNDGRGTGHKPMRHDIQKLKGLADLAEWAKLPGQGQPPDYQDRAAQASEKWDALTQMTPEESQVARIYAEVKNELMDTAATGYFEGQENDDPYKATLEVLTGKHKYWPHVVDNAIRNGDTADLRRNHENGHDIQPSWNEEEARKLLSSVIKKQNVAQAPKIWHAISAGLLRLKEDHPESYKLWPWYVKQVKQMYQNNVDSRGGLAQSAYAHWVDIVGNAGKQIAELRRENKLPQNFDINKMDIDDLENWHMDWKRENNESEDQGEVVYQWDDGWTMQRLTNQEQLQFEGDTMGHCVGDYGHHVDSGQSIIYSLRDPKGHPHVTIEMEGPELLKKLSDKPMSEFDSQDVQDVKLGDLARGGQAYPTPLFEDGDDFKQYQQYGGMGKDNRWPNYLTKRQRATPHDVQEDEQYYNTSGVPWDKSFYVVQVQGNSNSTPKPEYQARVKEFMDYLKSKGFKFQRSDEWYAPHDARDNEELDGYDNYSEWAGRQWNQGWADYKDNALGWYEHYKSYPHVYGAETGEDEYGIQRERKYSGYAPGVVQDVLEDVLEQNEDPAYAAKAMVHWAMSENMAYADMDAAVRAAEAWMRDHANEEHETNWQTDNGTWMYFNPETGEDEEVEDYDDMPEDSYFNAHEDPKYIEGYKFLNALDQLLVWYYNNKKQADADRHPAMQMPQLQWTGDSIPNGFISGTDPYAPSAEEQAKADAQAQQDAGPGFSSVDMSGVFS